MLKNKDIASYSGFTIIELIGTMGILIMLFSCFYTALNGLTNMQDLIGQESRACIVMNNTALRIEAEQSPGIKTVSLILADEFQKSLLSKNSKLTPVCSTEGNAIFVRILKTNGKPLTSLRIGK